MDSDRDILEGVLTTLRVAISNLRNGVDPEVVANDLSWQHDFIANLIRQPQRNDANYVVGGTMVGNDPRIRFARADKRERIADEVDRGEHRDD